jgi:serine/threonine protein phosphatase 1
LATIAIGDIHGNREALGDLLEKLLPEIDSQDTLVFLGDYIDRGPDSRGCIEEIVRLAREAPFSVVPLLGNHEEWMLATMHDYTKLRSAVDEAGPRLKYSRRFACRTARSFKASDFPS